jgi:hypothetical protein
VVATAPYINLNNGYYCPSASWNFTVSPGGPGTAPATGGSPV